jgi:2-polyprenyl-3-methyl-5-hydroxy-6-metoxy-1,4-benzoquinol methylase
VTGAQSATPSTDSAEYAERLVRLQDARWKRVLDVQAPYRWNLRRLRPGFVLDVGCGIGRNLRHLGGSGVGIDHNESCIAVARQRGLTAYTPEEFRGSEFATGKRFDSLLFAHVLEHLDEDAALALVREYVPHLKTDGRLLIISPQEAGQVADPTHVRFVDFDAVRRLARAIGYRVTVERSFPFWRRVGRVFRYNEFVVVCELIHLA